MTTLARMTGSAGNAERPGSSARFGGPNGKAVDSAGNVYVAEYDNNAIRKGYPAPAPAVIRLSGPALGSNPDGSGFGFSLMGPAGASVVVEASTDLVSWLPVWTNTFTGLPEAWMLPALGTV